MYWAKAQIDGEWQTLALASDRDLAWFRAVLPEIAFQRGASVYFIYHVADREKSKCASVSNVRSAVADTSADRARKNRSKISESFLPGFANNARSESSLSP